MDVHSRTTEVVAATPRGRIRDRWSLATAIPDLTEVIETVPRPRTVVFEEGPMADWLCRHLRPIADRVIVCDPRRNHLVANDGDKDDPIDARKLLQLAQGEYIREVHHSESDGRAAFKRRVRLYHDRIRRRVAEANRVIWFVRQAGLVITEEAFADADAAREMVAALPDRRWRLEAELLLRGYRTARQQEFELTRMITRTARRIDVIRRWAELPGVKWIRGATFYAYVDTPWRFKSKAALWKYMGIGLERCRSGEGPKRKGFRLPRQYNRVLKGMILGAAMTATSTGGPNPFADQQKELITRGLSPRTARRTVGRSQAAVMWAMWKTGTEYHPEWVGIPAAELTAIRNGSPQQDSQQAVRRSSKARHGP
jgi:transposase